MGKSVGRREWNIGVHSKLRGGDTENDNRLIEYYQRYTKPIIMVLFNYLCYAAIGAMKIGRITIC